MNADKSFVDWIGAAKVKCVFILFLILLSCNANYVTIENALIQNHTTLAILNEKKIPLLLDEKVYSRLDINNISIADDFDYSIIDTHQNESNYKNDEVCFYGYKVNVNLLIYKVIGDYNIYKVVGSNNSYCEGFENKYIWTVIGWRLISRSNISQSAEVVTT